MNYGSISLKKAAVAQFYLTDGALQLTEVDTRWHIGQKLFLPPGGFESGNPRSIVRYANHLVIRTGIC